MNGNDSAFPIPPDFVTSHGEISYAKSGLTKRELFAAMAMQGLCAYPESASAREIAQESVKQADALIEELSKEQK